MISEVGKLAATYFKKFVENNNKIVFSCGATINQMINHLDSEEKQKRLTVYSSIVLCKKGIERISPSTLIHNFRQKFENTEGVTFNLPENIRKKMNADEIKDMLDSEVFDEAMDADYFFLGIGSLRKSTVKQVFREVLYRCWII